MDNQTTAKTLLFQHISLLKPDIPVKIGKYTRVILHKFTTLTPIIGHKKLFQIVAAYGRPKILADNQKLQPGCPWDNPFLLIRTLYINIC